MGAGSGPGQGADPASPTGRPEPSRLVSNERTKLSATALNGIAIGSIAAGFITPLAAVSFGIPGAAARGLSVTVLSAVAWLVVGGVLHILARQILGGLRD